MGVQERLMKRFFAVFCIASCVLVSCGPETKDMDGMLDLSVLYKFKDKGVKTGGDTMEILWRAYEEIHVTIRYSTDNSTWQPVAHDLVPRKTEKSGRVVYLGRYLWKLPKVTTDQLKLKITGVTPDGRRIIKIKKVKALIDSVVPKSKVTFNPLSL